VFLVLSTVTTIIAFISTNNLVAGISCFVSAVCLALLAGRGRRLPLQLFLYGVLIHLSAFYWLPQTLQVFGGFDNWLAISIHCLFAVTAALQWLLIGFVVRSGRVKLGLIIFPIAYAVTDLAFPQMFPWSFANPLITFHPLSAYAEIFGSKGVSFILLILATLLVDAFVFPSKQKKVVLVTAGIFTLVGGAYLDFRAKEDLKQAIPIRLGLVQGNISIDEKSDRDSFSGNLKIFQALSQEALDKGAEFIIWPETTVEEWTPNSISSIKESTFDPKRGIEMNLLYGLLSYEGRNRAELKRYNSAFLLDKSGTVQGRYAKKVLMPFGEFLPFESTFPWLRDFSPMSGDFQAGTSSAPLELQLSDKVVRPGILICYEDLVPKLARDSANEGGNILINMTNDSWYGDTAALWQHSLLASWRTIETRRTLVRATNTGRTTIISPLGDTVNYLENFKRSLLVETAFLTTVTTVYSRFGDIPFIILLVSLVLLLMVKREKT
jgi:apolipoprotein N-acyltransferase